MLRKYILPLLLVPLLLLTTFAAPALAAEIRTGEQVSIETAEPLINPYIFGGNVRINTPISNELTTAGGDVFIDSDIEGSALIAGGNISLRGAVGNNARIAGGNVTIDSPITNDLVVAGGSITVTPEASVGGDLLFAGGSLRVEAPVDGTVRVAGGNVVINSTVNGDVTGELEKLELGPQAVIRGNLSYKSPERAQIAQGAAVQGRTDYKQSEPRHDDNQDAGAFVTGAALYKLLADIIITVLFIYFFRRALTMVLARMKETPLRSGAIGFGFFFLLPLAALFLLILVWLGVASFIFYTLMYIIALFVVNAFIGWMIMSWWKESKKEKYILDWRAGIIGPIVVFLLLLIPILGWLAIAVVFLIGLGALIEALVQLVARQKSLPVHSTKSAPTKR